MTHEELERLRKRFGGTLWADELLPIFAYVDELHGVVHDLRQEPGWELGRREGLRIAFDILHGLQRRWGIDTREALITALDVALNSLVCRGPVAPHLAPDDLRRENEALRAALTAVVDAYRSEDALTRWSRVTAAIHAAVPLLGEDV